MVSGVMMGGLITGFLVTAVLTIGAIIFYFKKRQNVQGTFFVLVLGMVGVVFTQTIADVVATLVRLPVVMEYSYLLAMAIYGVIIALIDMLFRLYFVGFMGKSGLGKIRGMMFSCGYVAGLCLMPACNQFLYILYAKMINEGVFLDGFEVGSVPYEQALAFQGSLLSASPMLHYAEAVTYIARAVLYCFICMALVRGVLEGKKGKSFAVLLAIRAGYEVIYRIILSLCSAEGGAVYSDTTALWLSVLLSAIVIAACLYAFRLLMKDYPQGKEPRIKGSAMKQRVNADVERKKSLAWQEVRSMNGAKKTVAEETAGNEEPVQEEAVANEETVEEVTTQVSDEEKSGEA